MKQIASTTARMFAHLDRLAEIKRTKQIRPITVHLSLTDKCNLNCSFCSVKNRCGDELCFDEAKEIVDLHEKLGVKSVELTGGGDATSHPHLADMIHYIHSKGLGVGLITNGLLLNEIDDKALRKLTWLRISLSGVDFGLEQKYLDLDTNRFPTFVGVSYVFTEKTTPEHISKVNRLANHLGAKYIRIVPNCYTPETIEWTRRHAPPVIRRYPGMFLQIKDYSVPEFCYWRYIKPFVNSDGYVYHCSTCALFKGYFSEEWKVSHWTEIAEIYNNPVTSFDNSRCTLCFYSEQNDLLHDLLVDVKHPQFT